MNTNTDIAPDRAPKVMTAVRMSPEGRELVTRMAADLGISRTAVIEMAIRVYAAQMGYRDHGDAA